MKNPVTGVAFLREDNRQMRVVTDEEFRSYLMACSQPVRDVAIMMYSTGMRNTEVVEIKDRRASI